jgi:uncharacterized protein involved in exopolysaccharide biosynthesis
LDEPVTRTEDDTATFEAARPMPRPSPPTIGEAAMRNWALILVFAILLGGLGVAAGLRRDPVYTSTATLSVGQNDLTVQSIPGFAVGGEAVAASLSRSVRAREVLVPAARKLGVTPPEVASHVSATPIPQSTLFTVSATGRTASEAAAYANAASAALVAYGRDDGSQRSERLLESYKEVSADLSRAKRRLARARRSADAAEAAQAAPAIGVTPTATPEPDASSSATIARLQAQIDVLELQQETAAVRYRDDQSQRQFGALVERVAPAVGATSDRDEKLQLFGGLGVLAGLCVGLALAVMRTAWRRRRLRT